MIEAPEASETAMAAAFARAIKARDIDIEEVPKLADQDAREIFREVRWADTDGRPTCPICSAEKPYDLPSRIGAFRCRNKACQRNFSMTSKTVFASRKTSFQNTLIVLGSHTDPTMNATRLCDVMGVSYKTALSFAHRFGLPKGRVGNLGAKRILMSYPYMPQQSVASGADLIMQIVAGLPPGLPPEMIEDVSQELALAVLCGDVQRDNISGAIPTYMRAYNRMFSKKYGDLSLDAPVPGTDGLTYGSQLRGESSFEYWDRL